MRFRIPWSWVVLAAGSAALCAGSAHAQSCPAPGSDEQLAQVLAPRFTFLDQERYFPTLPYATAFLRDDGTPRSAVSLLPEDLAPGFDQTSGRASWSAVAARYDGIISQWSGDAVVRATPPPATAVFYRVRDVENEGAVWDFLRSDRQAWTRNDMDRVLQTMPVNTPLKVAEYYLYYVDDTGLEGHAGDIEFVYVFVPEQRDLWCRFQIWVGAGHTSRNPNNVLVRVPPRIHDRRTVGVIVELGGHASAPDLDLDGTFVMGVDINWGLDNVWGTRDLLAISGAGYLGQYRSELTFPRSGGFHKMERRNQGNPNGYHLLPVHRLEQIDQAITSGDRPALDAAMTAYANGLGISSPVIVPDASLPYLGAWTKKLIGGDKGHRIWEHDHYASDAHLILKQHLYRPGPGFVVATAAGSDEQMHAMIGVRLSAPNPLRGLNIPGLFEILWQPSLHRTRFSVLYENSYADHLTWHLALGFDDLRKAVGDAPVPSVLDRDPVWVRFGPTLVVYVADRPRLQNLGRLVNGIRVRTGPVVDVAQIGNGLERLRWGFEIAVR